MIGAAKAFGAWRWSPLLLTVALIALVCWGWTQVLALQAEAERSSAVDTAARVAQRLQQEIRRELELLDGPPATVLGPDAQTARERLFAALPGLVAVELVTRELGSRPMLRGPTHTPDGGTGFELLLTPGPDGKAVAARFELGALVAGLGPTSSEHQLELRWDGRSSEYDAANAMAADAGAAWIETWHPLASSPWVLVVRPRDTAAAVPSLLPTIFLVTGLIASGTIGALFWSVRLARRRSRTLVDTNLAIGQILDEARAELHVTRDDRTSIETEIRQRTDELRDAVAELDALNASVSHDLRSPIGAIVNFTSLVRATQGDRLDEEGQTFLRRIESSAVRALGRMDGLLLYSRVGRQPLRRERLEMTSVARRVLQDARRLSAVRWETTLQPLPDVDADPHLTELLLRQLVDNAMKFAAAAAKPQIEIGAVRSDGEGPVVYFVRDNGAGFAGEGSRLFGLFERGHAPGEFEGAGLGLAIARRIVGRHLGRIWAEGSPGQGATFSFVLEAEHDGRRAGERSGAAAG